MPSRQPQKKADLQQAIEKLLRDAAAVAVLKQPLLQAQAWDPAKSSIVTGIGSAHLLSVAEHTALIHEEGAMRPCQQVQADVARAAGDRKRMREEQSAA